MSDIKGKTGAVLRETAVLTGAVAIIAAGVFFFLVPSHTSVSSISGLGIVLSNFVPLPLSVITMILNVVLYLRQRIWRKDRIHQCAAAGVSGAV